MVNRTDGTEGGIASGVRQRSARVRSATNHVSGMRRRRPASPEKGFCSEIDIRMGNAGANRQRSEPNQPRNKPWQARRLRGRTSGGKEPPPPQRRKRAARYVDNRKECGRQQ